MQLFKDLRRTVLVRFSALTLSDTGFNRWSLAKIAAFFEVRDCPRWMMEQQSLW